MYTKQEIILRSHRDGFSQRQITRDLGISRKTVSKYISQYNLLLSSGKTASQALSICLSEAPTYNSNTRGKIRLTQEVETAIDLLLEQNQKKRISGLSKQQLKNIDILALLHGHGFDIGYTTVCNYIRKKETAPRQQEAFIRQVYEPGSSCEFDWGEVKLTISGQQRKFQLAVFTSAYSNYRYSLLYERQDTLAFMESHVMFFLFTGGVYPEMVYDNMRVAVAKFVGRHEKEPTRALLDLRGHYGFSHRFCNAYRGNEKGHVERSVEHVRRKAFGLKDNFATLEEANSYLLSILKKINNTKQQLTGKSANEMFAEEKQHLLEQPETLEFSDYEQLRVDKYATISYRTNRYSVSDKLVGKFVDVKIYSSKLEVFYDNQFIAIHERVYGKHQWTISIEHYLNTFKRKPGALPGSLALASREQLNKIYNTWFTGASRDFIELLHYCHRNHIEDIHLAKTVERLTSNGGGDVTSEKLMALLGNKQSIDINPPYKPSQTGYLAKNHLIQTAQLLG
jgi:transposase